jgi:uncharacterized RmlC-like cupin family protein
MKSSRPTRGQALDSQPYEPEIVLVRPKGLSNSKQKLPYYVGISGANTGSRHLSLNVIVIPPGGAAEPHVHRGYETAIYVLQGRVETRYGEGLKRSMVNQSGDFLFIPPDLPHQPVNLSSDEPAMALVARNDPNEQESVVLYEAEG